MRDDPAGGASAAIITEDDVQMLRRAELRIYLTEQLSQLPSHQGLAIAIGAYIDTAKRHGLTLEKAVECLRKTWHVDHKSGPVHFG